MRPSDHPSGDSGADRQPVLAETTDQPEPDADGIDSAAKATPSSGQPRASVTAVMTAAGRALSPTRKALAPLYEALAPVRRAWQRLRPPAREKGADRMLSAEVAGSALGRLTALPALLMMAWLLPALPLLLAGSFTPLPMLVISIPLAVALTVNGLRVVPAAWPRLIRGRAQDRAWTYWFGLLGTVAVVAALTAWQLRENSEALIVTREPGAYMQTAYWIAQHGSLPIPDMLRAFGGAHSGLTFASTGFLSRGTSVYPAVMPGLPLLLAGGSWIHAVTGALALAPILGGLATLCFAGLVARLAGPQWAPAGALVLGLSLPQQYISRTTLSETALQIMLFGGLSLLVDALVLRGWAPAMTGGAGDGGPRLAVAWRRLSRPSSWAAWLTPPRVLALLAGLALGLGLLISLDGLLYLLPVIPFCCVLIAGRQPQATPFLAGLIVGCAYGIVGGYVLGRPLVDTVGKTVALGGVVAVWLIAVSVIAIQLPRIAAVRRVVPRLLAGRPLRWLPEFGAFVVAAALIGFAIRPYVQTVRGHPSVAVYEFIGSLQRMQGLRVDPTRLYSEQTLYWVIWYIGLPTVLIGGFGLALLVRRCLRALITWRDPARAWLAWGLPVAMICAGGATVLWAPDILPDQPWASRRLVVIVLPGLIICGLWAASWLTGRARDRGAGATTAALAGLFCAAAMLVPTVATTFGLGFGHTGKSSGLKPVVEGMALHRTGVGQVTAIRALCAFIPRNASVVIISGSTAQTFAQVIRGMCAVPVAAMVGQPRSAVDDVVRSIFAAGRRPVLLAATQQRLARFGGPPQQVLGLTTSGYPHALTQVPTGPVTERYVIWMVAPNSAGSGT